MTAYLLAMLFFLILALIPTVHSAPFQSRGTTYTGDGTFYVPGLGACGRTNTGSQLIVAVGHQIFDSYPGANPSNPNKNPICGKKLKASYGAKSVMLTVVDRCPGCVGAALDMTEAGFKDLAPLSQGRIHNVKWEWV